MKVRRIVTGHDAAGKAVFLSDGDVPRAVSFKSIPSHAFAYVWETKPDVSLPYLGGDTTKVSASLVPVPGGTSMMLVTFPPDSVMMAMDPNVAGPELGAALPGLIECFEPTSPGMHTTNTVDYGILLDGEVWLELDNGVQKQVCKGDIVIQNGTRHAWRNKTESPATMAFFFVGARR